MISIAEVCCQLQAGEAAVHVAARYGHFGVVEFLCHAGANIDLQDKVRKEAD